MSKDKVVVGDLKISRRHLVRRELESDGWEFLGIGNIRITNRGINPSLTELAQEYDGLYPEVQLKQYGKEVDIYVKGRFVASKISKIDIPPSYDRGYIDE
jgi:hypothetical protein